MFFCKPNLGSSFKNKRNQWNQMTWSKQPYLRSYKIYRKGYWKKLDSILSILFLATIPRHLFFIKSKNLTLIRVCPVDCLFAGLLFVFCYSFHGTLYVYVCMLCESIYNLFILRSFPSIAGLHSLIQTQQQITRISKVDIDCVFVLLWPTLDNKLHDKSAR